MSILRAPDAADHGPLSAPPAEAVAAPRKRGDRMPPGLSVAAGVTAMVCVGGSVAVSSVLAGAPVFTAEAVRYAGACLLLVMLARITGRRLAMPRGAEWLWLGGIALTGLVVFNVALVQGSEHAEPAVLGVAVACVPAVLAVIAPLLEGSRPRRSLIAAALVVTCGAALVQGVGRTDAIGVAWAVVVFGCEAAFTLLAIPVLGRHGPWGVSVHATWLAAVIFGAIAMAPKITAAAAHLTRADWLAIGYLAVAVTAVAFVLWYSCVSRLGASQAGLLTGVAPVAAAGTGVLLGGAAPRPLVWAGIAVVAAGLALGFRPSRRPAGPAAEPAPAPPPLPGADLSPSLT
jgi:drug/metabolite transporter (DMT)-like permease